MTKTVGEAIAQLHRLDGKLGVGVGAVKERAKLQAIIDAGDQASNGAKVTRRGKRGGKRNG